MKMFLVFLSLLSGVSVLLLSGLTVSAVSLSLSPNVQQFFSGDSKVSLSCVEDGQTGGGWTVKRTRGNQTEDCGAAGLGSTRFNSSFCGLDLLSSSGGTFFCEHTSGQRSDDVTIIVSGGPLIIEVPAHPLLTGSDVTLRCKHRDGSEPKAHFFRDDVFIGSGPKGEFTLHHVSQSDEGLYSCSTDSLLKCKQSRLRVKDPPTTTSDPPTSTMSPSTPSAPFSSSLSTSTDSSSGFPTSFPHYLLLVLPAVLVFLVLVLVIILRLWRKRTGPADVRFSSELLEPPP
ncbi:uncharacterized protein LOC113140305 isoform X2 [Mastacembelus armatus]|uniref:uncharacterized protein LOC113140305 isoform X2 n=1 Tax=Mastacembelus armatus TaxID=205130 RepID=UPI000E45D97B|nr:uncharacterized protein LOC113140305 isoform X2 [Mastacembelus armatus]